MQKKCKCKDCGLEFKKGDQGDNEEFCLRCEHVASKNDFRQHYDFDENFDFQREQSEGCLDEYNY